MIKRGVKSVGNGPSTEPAEEFDFVKTLEMFDKFAVKPQSQKPIAYNSKASFFDTLDEGPDEGPRKGGRKFMEVRAARAFCLHRQARVPTDALRVAPHPSATPHAPSLPRPPAPLLSPPCTPPLDPPPTSDPLSTPRAGHAQGRRRDIR